MKFAVMGSSVAEKRSSIVRQAFWLLLSLSGFAGLYLHLGADFLGFTQVVVYIGGMKTADQPITYFWTFPLGMLVTIGLFANSALKIATGKGVSWKGRTYVRTSTRQ